jgi:hypothetical protein
LTIFAGSNGGLAAGDFRRFAMTDRPSDAMFERIGSYAATMLTLLKRVRQIWDSPRVYRRGEHYMRGPGPKWREKHGYDRATSGTAQQPVVIGDKWDF